MSKRSQQFAAAKAAGTLATYLGQYSQARTMPTRASDIPELDERHVLRAAAQEIEYERGIVVSMLPTEALVCPAYCGFPLSTTPDDKLLKSLLAAPLSRTNGVVDWIVDYEHHAKVTKAWLEDVRRHNVLVVNGMYVYPTHLLIRSVESYLTAIRYGQIGITLICALTFGTSSKLQIVNTVKMIAMSRADLLAGNIAQSADRYMRAVMALTAHDERIEKAGKQITERQAKTRIGLDSAVQYEKAQFESDWFALHATIIDVSAVATNIAAGGNQAMIALATADTDVQPDSQPASQPEAPTEASVNADREPTVNPTLAAHNATRRAGKRADTSESAAA